MTDNDMPTIPELGEALYGPQWQQRLASELDINLRTIQRWTAGVGEPRTPVLADIRLLIEDHIKRLMDLASRLPEDDEPQHQQYGFDNTDLDRVE